MPRSRRSARSPSRRRPRGRPPERARISSGGPWEARVGYSRAVRVGRQVFVSGCTAARPDGSVAAEGDLTGQTREAIGVIETALRRAGGTLADVVRIRIYLTDISRWEEAGRALRERFGEVRPASTMVEIRRLIDPRLLIEVEADAVLRP